MKFVNLLSVSFLVISCSAMGQDEGGLKKRTPKPVSQTSALVTRAEAAATFDRVADLLKGVLNLSVSHRHMLKSDGVLVTRSEIIEQLGVLYHLAEPAFKMTMHAALYDPNRIKLDDSRLKKVADTLLTRGCLEPYSVLVTGSVKNVKVREFGDNVGFFVARIAEMTHTPSTKWTPYLRSEH